MLVTLPEPLPVSETLELISGLESDKVPILGVLMNRVPRDPWNKEETEALSSLLAETDEAFLGGWSFQRAQRFKQARETLLEGLSQRSPAPWLFLSPEQGAHVEKKSLLDMANAVTCENEGGAA